jgi:acetylornithine deacetylase
MSLDLLTQDALQLLRSLIASPSFSREEGQTAVLLAGFFTQHQIPFQRHKHKPWASNLHFDPQKPTILLNSHHDTVKPNPAYTLNP